MSKHRFEEIRFERKKQIMESALHLFATKGFHQTSISSIAKHAGISKGLMYNYFESKDALLCEIIQEGFDQAYDNFDQNQDGILQKEEFVAFLYRIKTLIDENRSFWQLFVNLILQPDTMKLLSGFKIKGYDEIERLLNNYFVELGYDNPELEKTYCTSVLQGIFVMYIFSHNQYPINDILTKIIKTYT